MTAHPGSFCSPPGATDKTGADTPMICSVGPAGGRARWRRNGPSPARPRRPRGKRATTTTGGTLPIVNAGIDPTRPAAPAPAAEPLTGMDRIRDVLRRAREADTDDAARNLMLGELDDLDLLAAGGLLGVDRKTTDGRGTLADRYLTALRGNPTPTRVDGQHTSQPDKPNTWGGPITPGQHHFHPDGDIGTTMRWLGNDGHIDIGDGQSLTNRLGDLATDVTTGRLHPSQLPAELAAIRDRLPEGSNAHKTVSMLATDVDHPMTPPPALPDGTPDQVRRLAADLHTIPACRKNTRELDGLTAAAADYRKAIAVGTLETRARRRLANTIRNLANHRHESHSDIGKLHIDKAILDTVRSLVPNTY